MKSHWNTDEFAEHVIAPTAKSHAGECEDCHSEVEAFRRELQAFRDAVQSASERPSFFWTAQRTSIAARARNAARTYNVRFALASAVALFAIAVSLLLPAPAPQHQVVNSAHQQVDQDELLMRQVDDSLLSNVPEPLEPANLIASDLGNALAKAQKDSKK